LYLKIDVLLLADFWEFLQQLHYQLWTRSRVLLYTTGFYVECDVETYSRQFWTSYRRWHGSIHRTWNTRGSELMFQQVRASQQQIHAVVRSIETIDEPDELWRCNVVRFSPLYSTLLMVLGTPAWTRALFLISITTFMTILLLIFYHYCVLF